MDHVSLNRTASRELEMSMLKKSFRGYNVQQVDALMQKAIHDIAALSLELKNLQEEVEHQRAELDEHKGQAEIVYKVLMQANEMAAQTKSTAQRDADRIVDDARQRATEIEEQTRAELNDVRWDIERLSLEKSKFVKDFRSMLENRLRDVVSTEGSLSVVEGEARRSNDGEDAARA